MTEIRRPVFVSGENPGLTLYAPATDRVVAVASYWACVASPWGVGNALILWLNPEMPTPEGYGPGAIFTDNLALAQGLVITLTQHFPEFRGVALAQLAYREATCHHSFDGERYQVDCQTAETRIVVAWSQILDRKQVLWPQFPAGPAAYDLTTVICPCGEGQIGLNGEWLAGEVQIAQTAEGTTGSSAFLAFAETWIGPLPRGEAEAT